MNQARYQAFRDRGILNEVKRDRYVDCDPHLSDILDYFTLNEQDRIQRHQFRGASLNKRHGTQLRDALLKGRNSRLHKRIRSPDVIDKKTGYTALHYDAIRGYAVATRYFLDQGVLINTPNSTIEIRSFTHNYPESREVTGAPALRLAAGYGWYEVMNELLDDRYIANVNALQRPPKKRRVSSQHGTPRWT
ncbi:hypothetical protein K432DRAFT_411751 [Lepidopterella palustris CBS 459.81]|uniref:Ankyrin n=1 Tax=Lepidopterella palustris CBS 459.81 TaxID=1314670 RepID=A0A8E2DVX3_9PEZI|nr:hypothetical protein K432DRAFT_411751 [Lepidopterella palustris CBS 459.81]